MSTPKEIFLETIKPNGQPERLLRQYEPFYMCLGDPVMCYLDGPDHIPGKTSVNPWGITISFPENAPGSMPVHGPGLTVCPDITRWKETVHAPNLAAHCSEGWEEFRARCVAENNDRQMLTGFMATGIFEQCHFLMGFENTLTALYEHPDEMHELIEYITEYRMQYAKLVVENLHPEVMFTHDDWGTKDALFMKPEMWREFFKEPYRRFYGYFRSQGIITVHHADSYLVPIIDDMVEIGIQVWQGVLPENDIPALQRRLNGKLTLMGGLGAAIDRADSTPEDILAYTKDTLRRCGPGGHYIPSITYGMFGTVFPHVDQYLNEGIDAYNADLHMPDMHLPPIPRRSSASAPAPAVSTVAEETQPLTLLERIAKALERGQQKKLLQLCQQALDEGHDPQEILSAGLVQGMTELGEAFSANRVFVPEMLIAARCMTAATALLKPYMTGEASEIVGRACIGTVQGDMHDIGKNLVKIMMEGSGIEVYDLGTDVTPEQFVTAAQEHHCGIIACSSLLTTTMQNMRGVVELTKERGIRDKVKIMVGGAPISQSFCDEIGADVYTEDAASAARVAVSLLRAQTCTP